MCCSTYLCTNWLVLVRVYGEIRPATKLLPQPPPHPKLPGSSWTGGVCGRRRDRGLLSLNLCSAWGPGNLGLEGKQATPKQEMLLWAPAAGGQGVGGGVSRAGP